ncbi:MAG: HD domain-containing protein [Deltaproteobacteria bacterium]|nr:HD domain-containing protein [Deltaproteobacteria bacterium]
MRCPGQDSRFWKEGAIYEVQCPQCGKAVEFFKDESARKCRHCGHRFLNPRMDFGCATYCKFAAQCLGELPPELLAQRKDLLKDRVALEMKAYFQRDFKRINHAMRVARYAESIVREEGGDPGVVIAASYLHDIGIKEAECKHHSSAGRFQELEGPPIAREILQRLGAGEEMIEEVCDIIGHHHHPREDETVNFKCLYDADLIVNLEENMKEREADNDRTVEIIEKVFLTEKGRALAREVLMNRLSRESKGVVE